MGKPLSRPDCLRRNPTCLGKGEDEDGYIEDCYVPQRSIYDTMRINEQIDQGSKLNQTSKSTMEKMDGSTLSSNGTLGASSNVFESRVPEGKKLDERIIFDALKLSSDVQKSAPVPPRRRPNAERKDNVNRRSWKSFMPPNFPEFAERMEASLSEVSEAGASNPSLHEKKESSSALTESSGQFDHREPQSESVTLEHMSKSVDIPEVQNVKNLRDCQDFRFQQHSESSPHEFQPLDSEAAAASGNTDEMQDHRFSSATWPRAMKSSSKGGLGEKQHPLGDTACTVELPPLSPCLSEELLDPELHILITPSLREKTESELKFEEDERWIMMEAEEEWEEEKLSEKRKSLVVTNEETSMADPFEESDQANTVAAVEDGSDCVAVLALHQMCCSVDLQPTGDQPASVPEGTPPDCTCVPTGEDVSSEMKNRPAQGLEGLISGLQCPVEADQLSDTDSVQMFLELEKECLCEEGVTSSAELLSQASFEGLAPTQDAEDSLLISHSPGAALEQEQHVGFLSVRVKDPDTGLDGEHCNALESSQVSQAVELSAHPDSRRDTSTVSKECEKVPFSPKTGGKFKPLADLEPLGELDTGGLLNSNLSGSCEESLPVFIASEPAKENGNLSQVDCSQTEGNVEEYMERIPLSFAFNYEQDVTSGPEVEVLSSDSNLLTDEIQLESEKGAIISQEDNNLASLENIDPYELSTEKVCDKDGETKEPDCQGKLLGNGAPAHFLTDFQRRSSESEVLNLQLLAGELRLNKAGAETVSDKETQLSVTLSQEGEVEMRGLDSTLNIFPDEQITKASNTVPGSEEWISSQQMPAPAAVVPMAEDALDAVVPMPGEDIPAVALPALEGPAAKASASEVTAVATPIVPIQKEDIPVASVVILMEDVTAAAISASEQTAASSGTVPPVETVTVPIIDEDVTSEEPDTQAAEVFLPEESAIPAPTGPTSEEPDTPTVTVSTAEEPDTRAGSTPEECTVPALEETIPEKSDTQVVSMSIPEWSATPATSVPAKEIFSPGGPFLEGTTHTDSVSIAEETPVLENASSPGMWIKEGFDSSVFGIKEVPGTMLHGKVPLAATDGLNSHEMFQKEQVDPLQVKLQQVNGLGQGLIQSAGKTCDVQGLEHDMEEVNTRWNTLNKKVAQRIAQLQEALLHCGKFQDALEPLLSWLTDTEELIANQKPPSAEYKVVKAQIQEQKLLQRLLDDRKATVDMLQAEGGRIAQAAELADREKITGQLESLECRWTELLSKAAARQKQLEDILVLAKQFHETAEPISDFLSVTEKKLANSEPVGTQTAKIHQQIIRHKALEEEIENHAADVQQAVKIGQSLSSLICPAEQGIMSEKLDSLQARYSEIQDRCCRKASLLEQALFSARLFGEDEVEVLNWLAEVEDKLSAVFVKDYRQDVLQKQHADHLALNEEIINRKKNVDQAIKNGQALLKQTTGEEVLLIQEKLDGIKTRYADITVTSSKALRTLEQARQLATKFHSTYEELTGWLREVEEELAASGGQSPTGEQIPQFQQRQKELKKEVMEHRLVLDTVNEVSHALLELVPWRAREGLDKLVSDANEQYKLVSDTVGQRVDEIDAAIQRSQQYEQAADAELAWVAETKRKLMALGPIRLEQDQTTAQLQVQKAFSIDIIRHKDSMDELFSHRGEIFSTCGEEQKAVLQEKTECLIQQYEAVSLLNSERYARLERAQVLVNQFWETYEELSPWAEETLALIAQLPPPAVDHEQLRQQQEEMRQLRESIAEHKPHIDKILKIGPQLKELNPEEGKMVEEKYQKAENMYAQIKDEVRQRALALDEAVSQSAQIAEFHDKIEPMLETLENLSSRLRMPPLIPAEVDKIRECISDNKSATMELEKLQPSFEALKRRGEELIGRSQGADKDLAAKEIQDKLDQMVFFWEDIKARSEEREIKFLDVLELAEKFWYDMAALLTTIKDTQEIVHDLESPGIDPSIIKQQVEAAETIKEETDGLHEELEFIRILGADLIFACGETEKPEVKKSIDEMNNAWENLNRTWKERLEKLEDAMQAAVQYQDTLQAMFDWLDNTVIRLCTMPPVGTDLNTVKDQLNEMKEFKVEVYQQQIEMEKLNHQGELMLKKATDETDRDIIREPLTELKHLWENLGEKIAHRQHKLEGALLALGQFQHALEELMGWLTHTEELLDAQRPISGDPKVIEVELAKHHVLKNDVLAHQATVETVNKAGNELLESSAGDDASSLRSRLETMNQCWESVLQKTEEREQQLQSTLQQAQGFHSEIEEFLLELNRMESQLSASKPTGGLPETAREQLDAHMELHSQLRAKEEIYNQLLDKGRLMLLSRGDSGSGSKTEQSVALLEQKWHVVSSKVEERKVPLQRTV